MQILISILLAVFFVTTILFLIFFLKNNKKYKGLKTENEQLNKKYQTLSNEFTQFKNELFINKNGYYHDSVTILSREDKDAGKTGDKYDCIVYVKELDKYTNGESRIQLNSIEVISGFDLNQYEWIKKVLKNKFSSVKKTSDIEWLESVNEIKELRKNKLEKLENHLNNEDSTL